MKKLLYLLPAILFLLPVKAKAQTQIAGFASDPVTCDNTRGLLYWNTTTLTFKSCGPTVNTWSAFGGSFSGSIATNQVAYGSAINTIGGSNLFTWIPGTPALSVLNATPCALTQIALFQACTTAAWGTPNVPQIEAIGGTGLNQGALICDTPSNGAGNTGTTRATFACFGEQATVAGNSGSGYFEFEQNSRPGGGISWDGSGATSPGTLHIGVLGIVDNTEETQLLFTPDSDIQVIGPPGLDTLGFTGENGTSTIIAQVSLEDTTNGVFALSATDTVSGNDAEIDFTTATGIVQLFSGTGTGPAVAMTWDASQNTTFASNLNPASGHTLLSSTAPTILAAGCGGSAASIVTNNGTAAFKVNVGTSNTGACTVTMPTATTDWICFATDITTISTMVSQTRSVPTSGHLTTEITLSNYTDISGAHAWTDSDVIAVSCHGE